MSIGTKSATSLALLVLAAAIAWSRGHLRADYLAQLDLWVTLSIGAIAVIAGNAVFRFWRLWERSEYYFGLWVKRQPWGSDTSLHSRRGRGLGLARVAQGPTFELWPWAQAAIYISIFLLVGLISVNNRSIALLADFPSKVSKSGTEYCPEAATEEPAQDSSMLGCSLVLRAFKLGYTTNLGTCEPKKKDAEVEICGLRQADEPYLHYAWRLLVSRSQMLAEHASGQLLYDMANHLGAQRQHLGTLLGAQHDSIAATPRASHHLFTNLPNPRPLLRQQMLQALDPRRCIRQAAKMAHLLPAAASGDASSHALEHALSHLLFNASYNPVVAFCREHFIHWDAPRDSCAQIAKAPREFLAGRGALAHVMHVLERQHRDREKQIARGSSPSSIGDKPRHAVVPSQRIVSFQCLIVDADVRPVLHERTLSVDEDTFSARELRIPAVTSSERGQVELVKQLATLLVKGFTYGPLASRESVAGGGSAGQTMAPLERPGYLLSKLELLRDADLFLGHQWLDQRPDLLDVYPYHVHLRNFVEGLRGHYELQRGRL